MKHIGMIYTIKNLINGKQFIGKSDDAVRAMHQHFLSRDNHPLHKDIKEFGEDNFECGILYTLISNDDEKFANELELYKNRYIKKYNTTNPLQGYNSLREDFGDMKRKSNIYGDKNPNYGNSRTKKKVALCQMDGKILEEYPSILQASNETGFNISSISQVVNGKQQAVERTNENGDVERFKFIFI